MSRSQTGRCKTYDQSSVDYIVIGVGAAGAALCNRLSKQNTVYGIEAGPDLSKSPPILDPTYVFFDEGELFLPLYWDQDSQPNGSLIPITAPLEIKPGVIVNDPKLVPVTIPTHGNYPTGFTLGGGSSINGMQYVRGSSSYWDLIAKTGGPEWSAKRINARFKRMEDYVGKQAGHAHDDKGLMKIRQAPFYPGTMATKLTQAISTALQVPIILAGDYNDPATPIGSFPSWQLFQSKDGNRSNSALDFLQCTDNRQRQAQQRKPISSLESCASSVCKLLSSNDQLEKKTCVALKLFLETRALRLIWDKRRAIGVRCLQRGKAFELYAKKEIIVTCGIYSAKFLLNSGIGPKTQLKQLGVPVIYNNPDVGLNSLNQILITATLTANPADLGLPVNDAKALYTGGAFLPPLVSSNIPNIRGYELIGIGGGPGSLNIVLIPVQPQSRGKLIIQSADPLVGPLIDNNYLGDPSDIASFMAGIRTYLVPIAHALNAIDSAYSLIQPDPVTIASDSLLRQWVIDNFDHTHHWTGTNSMGKVVDHKGRVFGVSGLRVADVSILPFVSDGNTCGPAYVVADTIADFILQERE